jgi:predicted DsbA family dithiol-disulfide isomerase
MSERTIVAVPGLIEVYADACCPFAHVGLRRIRDAITERGREDVVIRVKAWPLEWINGEPLDPPFIAEEVDEIREQVAPDLFGGFRASNFAGSSIPAMALTARARAVTPAAGQAVALAVRAAQFERGLDIADPSVLAEIAAEHGVDPSDDRSADEALVRAEWEEGKDRGVVGSPHFFVGDENLFCPVLDIRRIDGHLRIRADDAAIADFLARALRV